MRPIHIVAEHSGHAAPITHVDIRRDGTRIATSSYDGTVVIWDIADRTNLVALSRLEHRRLVNAACWNPYDLSLIATASADKSVAVWHVSDSGHLDLISQSIRHTDDINSVAWLPDGERFICVSGDGRATMWHGISGTFIATVAAHAAHCVAVAVSRTGTVATVGEDGLVSVFAPDRVHEPRQRHYDCSVEGCAWSSDGSRLAIARDDGVVDILSPDLANLMSLSLSSSAARSVGWSADDGTLVVGSYDGAVRLVDLTDRTVRLVRDDRMWPRSVCVVGDLVAVGSFDSMPYLVNLHTAQQRRLDRQPTHGPNALAAAGGRLHIGCDSGLVVSLAGYPTADDPVTAVRASKSPILSLAAAGRTLYAGTYSGRVVRLDGEFIATSESFGAPLPSLLVHADAVIAGTYNGELLQIDPQDVTLRERRAAHDGSIKSLAPFAGDAFVSGATDRVVRLGSAKDRQSLWEHGNLVNAVASIPGYVVASASRDRTVRVGHLRLEADGWALRDTVTLTGPDESVKCVGLLGSAAAPVVLAGSYDFGLYTWHVPTEYGTSLRSGRLLAQFDQGLSTICRISADLVAVAGWDGRIVLVGLDSGEPVVRREHRIDDLVEHAQLSGARRS
jgi:WD40 repeat protein